MDWQLLGWASGVFLLGTSGLQALGAAYAKRGRLRAVRAGCSHRQQAFNDKLRTVMQWAHAAKPTFKAWSGGRSFQVAAVVDEAADCKSFYLVPTDGHPLPRFEPGQFLTFSLPVDPHQKPLVRCYSLSDRPREDYYRVTIKQARPPAGSNGLPLGEGSTFFHQRVQAESTLDVQSPQGAFFLDPTDTSPVVLVGAGVGITPILSMANTIAHERAEQTAYVFAGFGNSSEHPFRQQMRELNAANKKMQFDISYSRPMPADNLGRDYDHRGYVDVARLRQVLPSNNFRFYVCGPAEMMQTLVPALRDWGMPDAHIHYEAFGPATVQGMQQVGTADEIARGPCQVEFLRTGKRLAWKGDCGSLLDFAEEQGVPLDYGCRAGNCGQCLVSVKSGRVEHLQVPGLPLEKNQCLTCIGVPHGDVVLEA